jgi:hypothetical protein
MIRQTILHYRIVEKLGADTADSSRITAQPEVILPVGFACSESSDTGQKSARGKLSDNELPGLTHQYRPDLEH